MASPTASDMQSSLATSALNATSSGPSVNRSSGCGRIGAPHRTLGSFIYLSRRSLRARVMPGVTLGRRIADARERGGVLKLITVHRGTAFGSGGHPLQPGVKSSCTQIWVPAGFRSLAAVAYPHTSPSGSDEYSRHASYPEIDCRLSIASSALALRRIQESLLARVPFRII